MAATRMMQRMFFAFIIVFSALAAAMEPDWESFREATPAEKQAFEKSFAKNIHEMDQLLSDLRQSIIEDGSVESDSKLFLQKEVELEQGCKIGEFCHSDPFIYQLWLSKGDRKDLLSIEGEIGFAIKGKILDVSIKQFTIKCESEICE